MHYTKEATKLEAQTRTTNSNPKTTFTTWKGDCLTEQTYCDVEIGMLTQFLPWIHNSCMEKTLVSCIADKAKQGRNSIQSH